MADLIATAQVDVDSERRIYAYSAPGLREMFALVVYRCPACGSTGKAGSWCEGHSAPPDCVDAALRVERQPVLVPHAERESRTEIYDVEVMAPDPEARCTCGHVAYWHGQEIGDPEGTGECEFRLDCDCKKFSLDHTKTDERSSKEGV